MGDDMRVPWVTRAGMDQSGRAIIGSFAARYRTSDRFGQDALTTSIDAHIAINYLTADRTPEFPTMADEYFDDNESNEAVHVPEASVPGRTLAFILVGLAGLVGLCAIYPTVVLWLLAVATGGSALELSPITIAIATTVSLVLALLADRWIAGGVALLFIAFVPFAVKLVDSAIAGMSS